MNSYMLWNTCVSLQTLLNSFLKRSCSGWSISHTFLSLNCPSVKVAINVTTDKCYQNNEWLWGYRENDPMGGDDPYSASKGCSELITNSYIKSFFNKEGYPLAVAKILGIDGVNSYYRSRLLMPDCSTDTISTETI